MTSETQEQTVSADKLDQRRIVPVTGCEGVSGLRAHTDREEVTRPVGEDGHEGESGWNLD